MLEDLSPSQDIITEYAEVLDCIFTGAVGKSRIILVTYAYLLRIFYTFIIKFESVGN